MKPFVYAVFLRLPCELIPPWQRFHLADKLITAREFNAYVQPVHTKYARLQKSRGARTVRTYYSDDENVWSRHCTLSLTYKVKYTLALKGEEARRIMADNAK